LFGHSHLWIGVYSWFLNRREKLVQSVCEDNEGLKKKDKTFRSGMATPQIHEEGSAVMFISLLWRALTRTQQTEHVQEAVTAAPRQCLSVFGVCARGRGAEPRTAAVTAGLWHRTQGAEQQLPRRTQRSTCPRHTSMLNAQTDQLDSHSLNFTKHCAHGVGSRSINGPSALQSWDAFSAAAAAGTRSARTSLSRKSSVKSPWLCVRAKATKYSPWLTECVLTHLNTRSTTVAPGAADPNVELRIKSLSQWPWSTRH
jgi:hypothetical protein